MRPDVDQDSNNTKQLNQLINEKYLLGEYDSESDGQSSEEKAPLKILVDSNAIKKPNNDIQVTYIQSESVSKNF